MKHVLKRGLLCILITCGMILHSERSSANVYTVTNTADAGNGSLRKAITDANTNPGLDTIRFLILPAGNLFEGSAPNTYAVIQLDTFLPTITSPLFIDGSSQTNTNTGSIGAQTVGVDNISLTGVPYPDVYIVPSNIFVFPSNSNGTDGNGLNIDVANVTIKGLAISGFGNTHTNGGTASAHADIAILRSPTSRTINVTITECLISCDPLGAFPSLAYRKTKGNGILVLGNNETGTISNNYFAHSGTYGIHFNGNTDNLAVGPASTTLGNRFWTISGNRLIDISTNLTISAITRVSDGITLMKCVAFRVMNNYITDVEQMGVDIGYNSDSNYVSNNTVTGLVKTTAFQLSAGLRIGLCSESDTLIKNVIFNNNTANFKGGVWLDESTLTQTGIITKDNINNRIQENLIHDNNGSGIVISNNSTGACYNTTITSNSTYNNVGLGIDLNYNGTAGPTLVSVNDDGDVDTGPNNIQNFPIMDSVRRFSINTLGVYGKAPAGSTIEFFINDGGINKHGGVTLNYGEGKTFIGSAIEGSVQDGAAGVGSYNIDGNVATNNVNLFFFTLTYAGPIASLDSLTSTATVARNTSEFGPLADIWTALSFRLISFSSSYTDNSIKLNWKAVTDANFLYFDVEHSADGKSFSRLKTINPKSPDIISDYEFVHINAGEGKHFYRLRMVNSAGKINYSSVIRVNINSKSGNDLKNMNSFFTDRIDMKLELDKNQEIAVHLFNEAGKLIRYTQVNGSRGVNFFSFDNLQALAAGGYIIYIKQPDKTLTQRLIKQ